MATPRSDFDSLQRDLASLRSEFVSLVENLKSARGSAEDAVDGANGRLSDAIGDLGDRFNSLYDDVAERGGEHLAAVQRQIEERPVATVLAAFAVGFVVSRFFGGRR